MSRESVQLVCSECHELLPAYGAPEPVKGPTRAMLTPALVAVGVPAKSASALLAGGEVMVRALSELLGLRCVRCEARERGEVVT